MQTNITTDGRVMTAYLSGELDHHNAPAVREKTLLEVEYWINHSYLQQLRRLPDKADEPPEPEKADGNVAAEPETKYGD